MTDTLAIEVDPIVHARLTKKAEALGLTLAEIVDDILSMFILDEEAPEKAGETEYYLVPIRAVTYTRLEHIARTWVACECHQGDVSFLVNKMLETTSIHPDKGITLDIPIGQMPS